jgi:tetratricopeptide (TPR) repeat protein
LKSGTIHYIFSVGLVLVLSACSTRKDKFLNRNFQALNTEFNVLYNGDLALQAGISELKAGYQDNFWETLPVERMQVTVDEINPGESRNANFERAEEKAIKAVQRRSMLIEGTEKNPQIDEAYLLLGKARYYDQRFIPALEAFNYILYKSPESDKIYEAKIWREKTNLRLENDALAANNLTKLLSEIKVKDQIFADASATISQAYINLEQKDSAVSNLKRAIKHTKIDEEKARYRYIIGQLFNALDQPDSAFAYFQQVIDMKRKSPRLYIIQAHSAQAKQFDYKNGDTLAFVEKFNKLIADRENRPYLDILHHEKGLFYDKQDNDDRAIDNYNKSLRTQTYDQYLIASNYRNLAEIYFDQAKYQSAGHYYDSTLVYLTPRTREQKAIQKKRDNLVDVIKYEGIAQANDSILNILSLSETDRHAFYQDYIDKLRKEDEKREKELAESNKASEMRQQESLGDNRMADIRSRSQANTLIASQGGGSSSFYFYNQATVAYGKKEFGQIWGKRTAGTYWRVSAENMKSAVDSHEENPEGEESIAKGKDAANPKYDVEFYLSQLPASQVEKDSLAKERNFAYYQLGVIYKEKFREYQLAADRLEILLRSKPEERLVLPALYNLYRVYEQIDAAKALVIKDKILSQFPDSRYAQIISKGITDGRSEDDPEVVYARLFKQQLEGNYREIWHETNEAIELFTGEEIVPKFEMLKAILAGKLFGLEEYKKGLNYTALNYPNVEEGKTAERLLTYQIPPLENLDFDQVVPISWKILYRADNPEDKNIKSLIEKVEKFIKERNQIGLSTSLDIYTMDKNFFVIHGLKDEEYAKGVASILKEFKDYKIAEPAIVISNENYKVVQIKKSLEDYLNPDYVPQDKKTFAAEPEIVKEERATIEKPAVKNTPTKREGKTNENIIPQSPTQQNRLNNPEPTRGSMSPPSGDDPRKRP